jgi:hypothetical protein
VKLDFLKDRSAFVRRFVLAELLAPPRGLKRRRPPPKPPAPPPKAK